MKEEWRKTKEGSKRLRREWRSRERSRRWSGGKMEVIIKQWRMTEDEGRIKGKENRKEEEMRKE